MTIDPDDVLVMTQTREASLAPGNFVPVGFRTFRTTIYGERDIDDAEEEAWKELRIFLATHDWAALFSMDHEIVTAPSGTQWHFYFAGDAYRLVPPPPPERGPDGRQLDLD